MMYGMPNPDRGRAQGPTLQEFARAMQEKKDAEAEESRQRAIRAVVAAQWAVAIALLDVCGWVEDDGETVTLAAPLDVMGLEEIVVRSIADAPTPEQIVDGAA